MRCTGHERREATYSWLGRESGLAAVDREARRASRAKLEVEAAVLGERGGWRGVKAGGRRVGQTAEWIRRTGAVGSESSEQLQIRKAAPAQLGGAYRALGCAEASGTLGGSEGTRGAELVSALGHQCQGKGVDERGGGKAECPMRERRIGRGWRTLCASLAISRGGRLESMRSRGAERRQGRSDGSGLGGGVESWRGWAVGQAVVGKEWPSGCGWCLFAGRGGGATRRRMKESGGGAEIRGGQCGPGLGGGKQGAAGTRAWRVGWHAAAGRRALRLNTTQCQLEWLDPPRAGIDEGLRSTGSGPPVTACRSPSGRTKDPALAEPRGGGRRRTPE